MAALEEFDLEGRVALITGATRGLGKAAAVGLARAGASVVVSSRKQAACDAAAAEIRQVTGRDALALGCHVGEWDAVPEFVDRVYEHFGRVDVLVNNAGISPSPMSVIDMTSEYWDKVMSVNLKGPLRLAALVAPRMARRGGGSIINIASIEAYRGEPLNSHYSASKAALVNLSQAMAAEWAGDGVRVNVLCPGPFATELLTAADRASPGLARQLAGRTLLNRLGSPDELVGAIVYLASRASGFVTGEDHIVAGGYLR